MPLRSYTARHEQATPPPAAPVGRRPIHGTRSRPRPTDSETPVDVLTFCLLLADRLDVDVAEAITTTLAANKRKYPVVLAHGRAREYT